MNEEDSKVKQWKLPLLEEGFEVPLSSELTGVIKMPIDEAIDKAAAQLKLPLLGGPSGRGWSFYSAAMKCPHLWAQQRKADKQEKVRREVARPLQIGGLYHALQAYYYAYDLGRFYEKDRGLIRCKSKSGNILNVDAPDHLATSLLGMTEVTDGPDRSIILEAQRLFEAHVDWYSGREDVTPLAIEWLAVNADLNYTCRYDMVGQIGSADPLVTGGSFEAGSIVIYERKTASWLSPMVTEGWLLDGEILGELLNWRPSGCDKLFGPLAGLVVDIVTKSKIPQFHRMLISPNIPAVAEHGKWIKYLNSEINLWQAIEQYPKRFYSCFDRWGKCENFDRCAIGG